MERERLEHIRQLFPYHKDDGRVGQLMTEAQAEKAFAEQYADRNCANAQKQCEAAPANPLKKTLAVEFWLERLQKELIHSHELQAILSARLEPILSAAPSNETRGAAQGVADKDKDQSSAIARRLRVAVSMLREQQTDLAQLIERLEI